MRIAVDFDNTLALGNYGHISLLAPNRKQIERLKRLRQTINPEIIVVTARGGKANLSAEEKAKIYDKPIRAWLTKYGVPFDSISFNKEYANLYIDDQTIGPFDAFEGLQSKFTGNKVILTDTTAIKFSSSAPFEFEWYKLAKIHGFSVPEVLFCNDECIITTRIHAGEKPAARHFLGILNQMLKTPYFGAEYQTYLDNIPEIEYGTDKTRECVKALAGMEYGGTFFHGDLSTTNVLVSAENDFVYLIDPNFKHIFGSYLTDAGKAVFSLIAYEAQFDEAQKIVDRFGREVWYYAVAEGLRVCKYRPEYISIVNNIADLI